MRNCAKFKLLLSVKCRLRKNLALHFLQNAELHKIGITFACKCGIAQKSNSKFHAIHPIPRFVQNVELRGNCVQNWIIAEIARKQK